jgi:hypothetical protein
VEPDRAFLPSLNQRIAAIVESPTKSTLGFTRGTVVVVVVVSIVVSDATVVVVVVAVDSSGAVTESAPETDDPTLITNAALNKPAITRFDNLFITLTAYTAGNFPVDHYSTRNYPDVADHYKNIDDSAQTDSKA